jgi:hypothetical protein
MKTELTFRRKLKQRGLALKRHRIRPQPATTFLVYDKQGYAVVGDASRQDGGIALEEIQRLLDDPNSVLNKEL